MPLPKWMKKVIGTETVGTASAQLWGKVQDGVAEEAVQVARNVGADSIDWYRRNLYTKMELDGVDFNGGSRVWKWIQDIALSRIGKVLRGEQPKVTDAETQAKSEVQNRITKNGDSYLVYASTVGATLKTPNKDFTKQVQNLAASYGLDGEGLDFEEALSEHAANWPWGHYFTAGRWRKEITPHLVRTAYLDVLGKIQQRYCDQAQNREHLQGDLHRLADELGVIFERYSAHLAENTSYLIKPLRMEGDNDKARDEQERQTAFAGEHLSAEERQAIDDAYQSTEPLITKAELDRQIAARIKNVPLPQNLLNYGKAYQPTEEMKPEEHHLEPVLDRAPKGTPNWLVLAGGYNTSDEIGTYIKKKGTELVDEALELGAEGAKWAVKYNVSHYLRQPMVIGGKDFNKPSVLSRAGGWILDNALSKLVPTIKEAIYSDGALPGMMILSKEKVTVQLLDGEMDPKLLNKLGNLSGVRLKPNELIRRMQHTIEGWRWNDQFSADAWKERILPHVIRTCYRAQLQEICNQMTDDFRSSPSQNRELLWHGMNKAAELLGQIFEQYTTQLTEKGHLLAPLSEKDMSKQNDEYRKQHAALTGDRKKKLMAALDAQKPLLTRKEINQLLDEKVKSVTPSRSNRPDPMAQFERCLHTDSSDDPIYNMPKNILQAALYIRELNRTNERSSFFRRYIFNREYKRIQGQLETMKQNLWTEIEEKNQTEKVTRNRFDQLMNPKIPIECTFQQGTLLGYEQRKYAPPSLAERAADGIQNARDAAVRKAATVARFARNAAYYGAGVVADGAKFAYKNRRLIARAAGETAYAGASAAAGAIVATGRFIYRHEADVRHGIRYVFGRIASGFTSLFRRQNQVQEAEKLADVLEKQGDDLEEQENAPEEEPARNQTAASKERELAPDRQANAPEKKADVSNEPVILPKGRANVPDVPVMVLDGPDGAPGVAEKEVSKPKIGPAFEITQESLEKITAKFGDGSEEELYSAEFSEEARKAREEHEKEDAFEQPEAKDNAQPEGASKEQNEVPNEQKRDDLDDSEFEEAEGTVKEFPNENNSNDQKPVDNDVAGDQSTENNYNGQPAVNDDDSEFEEPESEDNEDELVELASYSGNGEAEQDDIAGAQAAASENADAGKIEEKPENDTVPDNTGDVYSEDGERFTEIEEDPELLLEVAQDNAVKRIQKRIDALQSDILKNEDPNQVMDEMGSLMECMTLIGAVREVKLTKDGEVTSSDPELCGKTPEQVAGRLDGFLSESGKTAEKESHSPLGRDPVLRSMLQKNGGDVVKNARSMVGNGNLVRTYQSYLQQKSALAHTEKANAENAPTKKNGKNLNNSL